MRDGMLKGQNGRMASIVAHLRGNVVVGMIEFAVELLSGKIAIFGMEKFEKF